jgi:hypothetical protein
MTILEKQPICKNHVELTVSVVGSSYITCKFRGGIGIKSACELQLLLSLSLRLRSDPCCFGTVAALFHDENIENTITFGKKKSDAKA